MGNNSKKSFILGVITICLQMSGISGAHANPPPYKLTVILDRIHYEAKPRKANQLDDDVFRSFDLYASFRVDGPASPISLCQVKFLRDPPVKDPHGNSVYKDEWGNILSPLWEGVVGDPIYRMPWGVFTGQISNNLAILPEGGTYECSLNEPPSTPPALLEVGGMVAGGSGMTHKNPPLIFDNWMAQLRTPDHRKTRILIDGVPLDLNEFWMQMDEASKSIKHSSNFVAEKWSGGTFLGWPIGELIKATAHWPFE